MLDLDLPILGLCYGHQLITKEFGGTIANTGKGEFGKAILQYTSDFPLWQNVSFPNQVWMSHQDSVTKCPPEFEITGVTESGSVAAMGHRDRPIYTLQFHPEVNDSKQGRKMLANFVKTCDVRSTWSMETFIEETTERLQQEVGEQKVLMFISGGVDSSVAFALLNKAVGEEQMLGLYINNGFMRKNESAEIIERYRQQGYTNIKLRDYSSYFLDAVAGQVDPQVKRQKIGATFIRMRDKFLNELNLPVQEWMLGHRVHSIRTLLNLVVPSMRKLLNHTTIVFRRFWIWLNPEKLWNLSKNFTKMKSGKLELCWAYRVRLSGDIHFRVRDLR